MQRSIVLVVLIGLGIAVGCGSGKGPPVPEKPANVKDESTGGGTSPSPGPNPEQGGTTQPRPNTSTTPVGLVGQPPANAGEVFSTPEQIFAGIPADAIPSPAPDGAIERVAAREWLKGRIVGKRIRWSATVTDVTAADADPWTVEVHLTIDRREINCPSIGLRWRALGGQFKLGDQRIEVCIRPGTDAYTTTLMYSRCTTAEARKLRAMKGKAVTFESTIKSFSLAYYNGNRALQDKAPGAAAFGEMFDACLVELQFDPPSLDGWLPEVYVPKPEKK